MNPLLDAAPGPATNGEDGAIGTPVPVVFTGNGGEYFRIWIVNLALTILTLGIYSAWAKVRRLQYFYRNTAIAGASFDYHGDPKVILKGRVIGVLLLVAYQLLGSFNVLAGLAAFLVLVAILPWLLQRSLRFKLANSSYRGLHFQFAGRTGGAYQAFLLWPLAGYVTLGLLMPLAHREIKAYQHNHARFGDAAFAFSAKAGDFYRIYLKALGMVLLILVGGGLLAAGSVAGMHAAFADAKPGREMLGAIMVAVMLLYLLVFLLITPWLAARLQNLVWNHTTLLTHRIRSFVRARDLLWLYVSNFAAIVLTIGLYKPFADIRLARYRLTHTELLVDGDLEGFLNARAQTVSALGEETADVFNVDISL